MIVLNNIVPSFPVGSVSEDGLEQGGRVNAEAKRSYYDNDVVTGRDGQHINVPPNGIEGGCFIMQPQADVIVYQQEAEVINGCENHLMPLHPQVL